MVVKEETLIGTYEREVFANGRDCEHGRLARSCEICELQQENAELRKLLREACGLVKTLEANSYDVEYFQLDKEQKAFLSRPEVKQILEKEE